jgi:hypothetical protein
MLSAQTRKGLPDGFQPDITTKSCQAKTGLEAVEELPARLGTKTGGSMAAGELTPDDRESCVAALILDTLVRPNGLGLVRAVVVLDVVIPGALADRVDNRVNTVLVTL